MLLGRGVRTLYLIGTATAWITRKGLISYLSEKVNVNGCNLFSDCLSKLLCGFRSKPTKKITANFSVLKVTKHPVGVDSHCTYAQIS